MAKFSLVNAFVAVVSRDLVLAFRNRAEMVNPILFFILIAALFPLGVGADVKLLQTIAPGIIWVSALLAAMLSLDKLFRSDMEDGSLEQFLLSAHPLSILILAKVVAHWLVTGLPLLLVSPILAMFFDLPFEASKILMMTLLLGTPVLSLIGAIGVALTVGLRSGGVLLSLLVLPLYIPVLIFSCIAVDMTMSGMPVDAHLKILSAMLFMGLALAPWPAAAALRISLN